MSRSVILIALIIILTGCGKTIVPPPESEVKRAIDIARTQLIADPNAVASSWYRDTVKPDWSASNELVPVSMSVASDLSGEDSWVWWATPNFYGYGYYKPAPDIDFPISWYAGLIYVIVGVLFGVLASARGVSEDAIGMIALFLIGAPLVLSAVIYLAVPIIWGGQHYIWGGYAIFLSFIFTALIPVMFVTRSITRIGFDASRRALVSYKTAREKNKIDKSAALAVTFDSISFMLQMANELDGSTDDQQTLDEMNNALTSIVHGKKTTPIKRDLKVVQAKLAQAGHENTTIYDRIQLYLS